MTIKFNDTTTEEYQVFRMLKTTWNVEFYKNSLSLTKTFPSLIIFPEQLSLVDNLYFVLISTEYERTTIEYMEYKLDQTVLKCSGQEIPFDYDTIISFDTTETISPLSLVAYTESSYMSKILNVFGENSANKKLLFADKKDAKKFMNKIISNL